MSASHFPSFELSYALQAGRCISTMQACTSGRALLVLLLWFISVSPDSASRRYGVADQAVDQLQPLAANIMAIVQHRQVRACAMHLSMRHTLGQPHAS
jgi:hypothetical protein